MPTPEATSLHPEVLKEINNLRQKLNQIDAASAALHTSKASLSQAQQAYQSIFEDYHKLASSIAKAVDDLPAHVGQQEQRLLVDFSVKLDHELMAFYQGLKQLEMATAALGQPVTDILNSQATLAERLLKTDETWSAYGQKVDEMRLQLDAFHLPEQFGALQQRLSQELEKQRQSAAEVAQNYQKELNNLWTTQQQESAILHRQLKVQLADHWSSNSHQLQELRQKIDDARFAERLETLDKLMVSELSKYGNMFQTSIDSLIQTNRKLAEEQQLDLAKANKAQIEEIQALTTKIEQQGQRQIFMLLILVVTVALAVVGIIK